jgi:crotonobetainyl-CoA:carnitine CoA-transferase CaiB-like acyl-CoA transferase
MALLAGYRVLELTDEWGLMGGRMLADLGADVVQVEPLAGSSARLVPPLAANGATPRSMYWEALAANKRGIVCDIDAEPGCEQLRALAARSDFFLTSLDPELLASRGLDWSTLSAANPELVYVQITPFGMTGPKSNYAASDLVVWAASGALHPNRDDVRPPMRLSCQQAALHAGADAAVAALIAHRHRLRTGQGQFIDVSAQASSAMATISRVLADAVGDDAPGWSFDQGPIDQSGSGSATPPAQKKWKCKDGYIELHLGVGRAAGRFTTQLCAWMRAEGSLPPEFEAIDWRLLPEQIEQGTLDPETPARFRLAVAEFFLTRTKEEANDAALKYRIGCSGIRNTSDVAASSQFSERGFWVNVGEGDRSQTLPGPFAKTSVEGFRYRYPAPRHGEHTAEVTEEWLASASPTAATVSIRAADAPPPALPLVGLKVLDLSWVVAGPMIGRALADFGATVVRAESDTHVDTTRGMKPHFKGQPGVDRSSVYANCNAGKLGIALDFEHDEARRVGADLAEWADVVIESYSPGVVRRWGLDYETLHAKRSDLVMLSSCLGGQVGPMAGLVGFGNTGAALSGFQALGGWPNRAPIGPFGPYTDYLAPRLGLAALLAALDHRDRTGEGCYIDISQIEVGVYFLSPEMADFFATGSIAQALGNRDPRFAPHGVYPALSEEGEDRFIAVAVTSDSQWAALASLISGPELAADRRYRTAAQRLERQDELDDLVAVWCATRPAEVAEELLQAHGVPAHRSSASRDFCEDEQLAHRHHLVRLPHPVIGESVVEGPRYQFSLTPGIVQEAAPTFGRDRDHILRDLLGYSEPAIEALVASGTLH